MSHTQQPVRLPPTATLRAFEAAARLGSFAAAAEELGQTPSAISHQVKALEQYLGAPLFIRERQRIKPSPAGQHLLPAVQRSMQMLRDAMEELRHARRSVRITLLPSIANRFLIRRIGSFIEKHPQVDLYISSTQAVVDLQAEGFDLALRYGRGPWERTSAVKLADEMLVPVASPALLAGRVKAGKAALTRWPLLRDDQYPWTRYLSEAGVRRGSVTFGPRYGDSAQMLEAVQAGMGIGLARWWLARDALADGSLAVLDLPQLRVEEAYHLVAPKPFDELADGPRQLAAWIEMQFR